MVESFETEVVHLNGSVVLMVSGEIDMATAPAFRAVIEQSKSLGAAVVVDLSGVTFMDSSGLHVLVTVHTQRVPMCVRNPSAQVDRLLTMTGLQRLICMNQAHDAEAKAEGSVAVSGTGSAD